MESSVGEIHCIAADTDVADSADENSACHLQRVVGEPGTWLRTKAAARGKEGIKVVGDGTSSKIDKELTRRASDGGAPRRAARPLADADHHSETKMDIEEPTPAVRPGGPADEYGGNDGKRSREHSRAGNTTTLGLRRAHHKGRAREVAQCEARSGGTFSGECFGIAPQPDWMIAAQSMFDKQGSRMECMSMGIDTRMSGLGYILMTGTAGTQQRMRYLEPSSKHDLGKDTEKQEQQFGEESRRSE